ncbi:MAG: PaaI family thioesterase [Chloroflexota bacterium]
MTTPRIIPSDNDNCFVCGKNNPCGVAATFSRAGGKVSAEFVLARRFQGYADIAHGGVITALLDEAMIQAALSEGITAVTAEIRVRFKTPLRVEEAAVVEAQLIAQGNRLIEASSRILRRTDRRVVAEASAKLIPSK